MSREGRSSKDGISQTGFPGWHGDHRRRPRGRRGRAAPHGRRGGAPRRPAAARTRPRSRRATTRRPRPGSRAQPDAVIDKIVRLDGLPTHPRTCTTRRAGRKSTSARSKDVRRHLRLRDRRRRRERPRGGEVLPRPLRPGSLEDPPARPAPRLRRALAPQRVPRPERCSRERRRDAPPQRRHGEPRQHRRLEPAGERTARHPRLLRAARGRHARLLRRRLQQLPGPSNAPGIPASFGLRAMLLFPSQGLGDRHARPEPGGGVFEHVPGRTSSATRRRSRRRPGPGSPASRPTSRPTGSPLKHGPKTDQEKKAILAPDLAEAVLHGLRRGARAVDRSGTSATAHGLLGAGVQAVSAGDACGRSARRVSPGSA